jgi:hypothetical protein
MVGLGPQEVRGQPYLMGPHWLLDLGILALYHLGGNEIPVSAINFPVPRKNFPVLPFRELVRFYQCYEWVTGYSIGQ